MVRPWTGSKVGALFRLAHSDLCLVHIGDELTINTIGMEIQIGDIKSEIQPLVKLNQGTVRF